MLIVKSYSASKRKTYYSVHTPCPKQDQIHGVNYIRVNTRLRFGQQLRHYRPVRISPQSPINSPPSSVSVQLGMGYLFYYLASIVILMRSKLNRCCKTLSLLFWYGFCVYFAVIQVYFSEAADSCDSVNAETTNNFGVNFHYKLKYICQFCFNKIQGSIKKCFPTKIS